MLCIKYVGSLCILKISLIWGGGGGISIYKRFWRKYPGTTEVCDVPLLIVVVPNKILLLGKEMEIQNNCFLKPGVRILLHIRCTCKSDCTHRLLTATAYVLLQLSTFLKHFVISSVVVVDLRVRSE